MPLDHLNHSQLREVEQLVVEADLEPSEFRWRTHDGDWAGYIDSTVPAFVHEPTKFFCSFADTPRNLDRVGRTSRAPGAGDHSVLHVPGRESRFDEHLYVTWRQALQHVHAWLTYLKRERVAGGAREVIRAPEPTGWARVDRGITAVRSRLGAAKNAEDFQTVALLCREVIISLAQSVFDPAIHTPLDGTIPSDTDAKRMLEAFLTHELPGEANEETRRHARAALGLAVALQHKRSATRRDAALCAEATTSIVAIVRILAQEGANPAASTEPFRVPRVNEPELEAIVAHYKTIGEEPVLPRMEERDLNLARGYRLAYKPGTTREVWVGFHAGSYELLLMLRPRATRA